MKIKNILVSQPKPSSDKSPYYELEKKYGVHINFRPFIKVEGIDVKDFRHQRVDILAHTAIVFTARTAVDHFFRLCEETRVTIPETMKYFCVSEVVALYLQKYIQYRKRKIFFPTSNKEEDLVALIYKHPNEKYLVSISDANKDDFDALFASKNINFTKSVMYRTVSNDFTPEEGFDYDMLVFFSPNGIASLKKNFPDFEQGEIVIATLGKTTAQAVKDAGLRLDIEAPTPQAPSITAAIEAYLKESNKKK